MATLRLLLDYNVPTSVAEVFRERGHVVQLVRDILPVDSPDMLIAAVSEEDGAILVSCDATSIGSRRAFREAAAPVFAG